jgi:hypothetical protein
MTRDPLRRATLSVLLGAVLPLGFAGSLALQAEHHALHADRAAFYILLPMLLFGMMAFAIWILMRQPVSSTRR